MVIKIDKTDKVFSAFGGLIVFKELIEAFSLDLRLSGLLPALPSQLPRNIKKYTQLIMSFITGAECLEDIDRLIVDPGVKVLSTGRAYCSKTIGDLLRSFSRAHCKQLNRALARMSFDMRAALFGDQKSFTLDIDSTPNPQYGRKMEGLAYNYDGVWCLDTIHAFDEYGLQYWDDVRPGNTFTANGAEEIIHTVFNSVPKTREYRYLRKLARMDSGFCNVGVFNACSAKDIGFVMAMRANMAEPHIKNVINWKPQNPRKKDRIRFYDDRECEIGETFYRPEGGSELLRVVFIRAVKKDRHSLLFPLAPDFDYFAFVTNIGVHEKSAFKLIKFYRGRGQAENYIREMKNGFDLRHYPCQKLLANKAYGLAGAFAYNFMRFVSLKAETKQTQYAKAIRFLHVYLPVQIVRHAGSVTFRFMTHHYKEVQRWLKHIQTIRLGFA